MFSASCITEDRDHIVVVWASVAVASEGDNTVETSSQELHADETGDIWDENVVVTSNW